MSLENIFSKAFTYLPKLVLTEDDLRKLLDIVLGNFIEDNVEYLELRSSPKKLKDSSFKRYFDIIIEKIKEY